MKVKAVITVRYRTEKSAIEMIYSSQQNVKQRQLDESNPPCTIS
jgi:hypothetical protein